MANYLVCVCTPRVSLPTSGGGSGEQEHLWAEGGAPQTRVYIRPSQSGYVPHSRSSALPSSFSCWVSKVLGFSLQVHYVGTTATSECGNPLAGAGSTHGGWVKCRGEGLCWESPDNHSLILIYIYLCRMYFVNNLYSNKCKHIRGQEIRKVCM